MPDKKYEEEYEKNARDTLSSLPPGTTFNTLSGNITRNREEATNDAARTESINGNPDCRKTENN